MQLAKLLLWAEDKAMGRLSAVADEIDGEQASGINV